MMNETFLQSLEIMWKGMASIFVVMIVLTVIVYFITKVFKDKEQEELKEDN